MLVAHGLCSCIGDVVYFDRKTHKRIVLEITRVAITQASISGSGVLAVGPDAGLSILRARERERRRCARRGAPRQHILREVRIGVRLPANHDEIAGEVAQNNVVLDLRVLWCLVVSGRI